MHGLELADPGVDASVLSEFRERLVTGGAEALLLDTLLHHATVVQIEGSSYRLRQHADLVPEAMRARPTTAATSQKRRGRPPKAEVLDPTIG